MKKKNLKSLRLKKSVVSNFKTVYGGADETLSLSDCDTSIRSFLKYCPLPPDPTPATDPALCTGGWGECPII